MEPVLKIITGPPRVGKTCRVVRRLVDDLLPFHDATYYTNLPLYVDVIADKVGPLLASRRRCSLEEAREEVFRRVVILPPELLAEWNCGDEKRGFRAGKCPGAWFADRLKAGDVIAIDEAHCYIPTEADKLFPGLSHEWKVWISQIGHPGAHLELMTQDQHMISPGLRSLGAVIVHLSPVDETRDQFTGVLIGDQWELASKWKGKADQHVGGYIETIFQKKGNRFAQVPNDEGEMFRLCRFKPEWFDCYNSNNAREGEEGEGFVREQPACQRLRWPFFLLWFWRRNATALSTRLGAIGLVLFLAALLVIGGTETIAAPMRLLSWAVGSAAGSATARPTAADVAVAGVAGSTSPVSVPVPTARQLSSDVARESVELMSWQSAIVLLSQQHLIFGDGQLIRLGESVQNGPYKGRTLKRLDLGRRVAQFDDGVVVQIGRSQMASSPIPIDRTKAGAAGPHRPKGSVAGPAVDPKFSVVEPGDGARGVVPVTPARSQSAGARSEGRVGSAAPGPGGDVGDVSGSGSSAGQSGSSGRGQSGGPGSDSGGRGGGASTDAVRAGSVKPVDGYITPARRQP